MTQEVLEGSGPEDASQVGLGMSLDAVSLTSVGAHLLFTEVNEISAMMAVDFILKANMVLPPDFPLTLFVNTPGGECSQGFAIINAMQMSRLPIATVGIGEVASMGMLILSAGTKGMRSVTEETFLMSHQFSAGVFGKQHELIAARKVHKRLENLFVRHFLRHSTMSEKQIREILLGPSDCWLTPKECIKYGIIDEIKSPWEIEDEVKNTKAKKKKKTK